MSIEATIARITAIRQALADPSELVSTAGGTEAPPATASASTAAPGTAAPFAAALAAAQAQAGGAQTGAGGVALGTASPYGSGLEGLGVTGIPTGGSAGSRIVAAAESQLGVTEQPPGSNEGPAIAAYRSAAAGAEPGAPWCAYFASWAARQAGEPIGPAGEGLGSVSEIWSWAQSTGRAIANGPGVVPQPGDLIVFGGEHVGIVRGVLPDGSIETIEGNYENKVAANVRSPTEATGYVNMG